MPGKEPMPQEIPGDVVHWKNEILKRNNIPLKSHFNDTNWTFNQIKNELKNLRRFFSVFYFRKFLNLIVYIYYRSFWISNLK